MRHRHKLGDWVILQCIVFALLLAILISAAVSLAYRSKMMNTYSSVAYSFTRATAEFIDGDRINRYISTGETDDYYNEVSAFLASFEDQAFIEYYYVFVPFEDHLTYVWDADTCLGYQEEYMDSGKDILSLVYRQDPMEKMFVEHDAEYGYIASAYSPIFNSQGEPCAIAGVDIAMGDILSDIFSFILVIVLSVLLIVCTAAFFVRNRIAKAIVQPIDTLHAAAESLVERIETGADFHADIHTGNEIEDLAHAFETMNAGMKDYIRRLSAMTAEKERIGAELNVASQIQASLLPSLTGDIASRKEFGISATMTPAKEVGGDFFDFFMVDEKHAAFVVADVSGKGVPAALFMAIAKTLIKDNTVPELDLGEVFTIVNRLLCESNSEEMFVTAFEGVLNLESGVLRYVNAGHEIPFVCRSGESYEPHKIRAGFVLAGMETVKYTSGELMLQPGDKIFQYTDGVTEATDSTGCLYGMERLQNVLARNAALSPAELLPAVKADIDNFVGEAPQFDDITMLCLEYKKKWEN